jgi:hypothetical protein
VGRGLLGPFVWGKDLNFEAHSRRCDSVESLRRSFLDAEPLNARTTG